ncbi:MAG: energy transducer TonB [Pyrinomonadaceae bacterium]
MKKFVLVALVCFCFGLNVFAQAKIKVLKYEIPRNSLAAAALGLKGEFFVDVKIDKNGKVISTDVEKVHPILRKPIEEAASKWLFSADKNLEERAVKIIFEYRIKNNNDRKNNYKDSKIKISFKKPYRLIISSTVYPRIDV